ncbi:MAG: aminoacyl-tRNA hydrolase [Patescibacteria group bacterium]
MTPVFIIGLGNPEPEYTGTRHNAGRYFVKLFAKKFGFPEFAHAKKVALVSEGKIGKRAIILILPETYMNNSGKAAVLLKVKKEMPNIVVVNDDIDLPLGKFKIVYNRGSGGHRGVESLRRALKTEAFVRLRIGIAPKKKPNHKELLTFLTSKFKPTEAEALKKISKKVMEALELVIAEGHEAAMNKFNKG